MPLRTSFEALSPGGVHFRATSGRSCCLVRLQARRGNRSPVASSSAACATSVLLALALGVTGAPSPHLDARVVVSIAVLGLVGTGVAYVLNYQIITSEGATIASTVTYLLPVVAIVLGVLVLSENITATILAGIALVLAGVALTRRRSASHDHLALKIA
jgi:drug/metabolite transporter (DMT)-like permease